MTGTGVGQRRSASSGRRPRLRVLDAVKRAASGGGSTRSRSTTSPASRGVAGDDVPDVPGRQGRALRGAAGPRARGVLRRAAAPRSTAPASLEDLLVRTVVTATRELRADDHLAPDARRPSRAQCSASSPSRACRGSSAVATASSSRSSTPYLPRRRARGARSTSLARLVISYFLAPSEVVDLGDETSARRFLAPFLPVLPDRRPRPALQPQPWSITA